MGYPVDDTEFRKKSFLLKPQVDAQPNFLFLYARKATSKFLNVMRFNTVSWGPNSFRPVYLAYYPDGLKTFPDLSDLYRRWIRGNRKNNNGDATRFMALMINVRQLLLEGIEGDFAELGVWRGNSAAILAAYAAETDRKVYLFDTFSGFDQRNIAGVDNSVKVQFTNTSVDYASKTIGHPELSVFFPGFFPDTITDEVRERKFALVHIDCDLYEPMKAALEFFYPRLSRGGMMILHDYSSGIWPGAARAIDEFRQTHDEFISLWPDKSGTATIRKTH